MSSRIKVLAAVLILTSLIGLNAMSPGQEMLDEHSRELLNASKGSDTVVYIIGSSRVQLGVNDSLISAGLRNRKVFNCGFSGGTFLSACMLADGLIKNGGNKLVLIELTPLFSDIHPSVLKLMEMGDLNTFNSVFDLMSADRDLKSGRFSFYLSALNACLVNSLLMGDKPKPIINTPKLELTGFKPATGNRYSDTDTYLKPVNFDEPDVPGMDLSQHLNYIKYLVQIGEKKQAQVRFFLPATFSRPEERAMAIAVFKRIPASQKILYPDSFFCNIRKAEYLSDRNHFNRSGADAYSQMLIPVLEKSLEADSYNASLSLHKREEAGSGRSQNQLSP